MIDYVNISLKAGNGGNGAVAFRREKFEPTGGPAGGDGGDGGSIYLKATSNLTTLEDFTYKKNFKAENGQDGMGKKMFGKKGEDLIIEVPLGTLVREEESRTVVKDMRQDGELFLIARGGKGGKGNARYKNSVRQAPRFAQQGSKGDQINLILELKMLADVGLVGLPNVGKSTFISVISNAKPKIANYPFTTLDPNLGVVRLDEERSFVVADIPGIIEGASEGVGLGDEFLKHIERCRILVHLVDISGLEGRNPIDDFKLINKELELYSDYLKDKPMIVVLNKVDLDINDNASKFIEEYGRDYKIFKMSAATRQGVKDVLDEISEYLSKTTPLQYKLEEEEDKDFLKKFYGKKEEADLNFSYDGKTYFVYGARIDKLLEKINFEDYESRIFFETRLQEMGVYDKLEEMGIEDGDPLCVGDLEFDYYK